MTCYGCGHVAERAPFDLVERHGGATGMLCWECTKARADLTKSRFLNLPLNAPAVCLQDDKLWVALTGVGAEWSRSTLPQITAPGVVKR